MTIVAGGKQASLGEAKRNKNNEFYTRLEDIEREVQHYAGHFEGKTVFLNCDDPYESDFFKYFAMSFNHLGLKKLIAVSYAGSPIVGTVLSLFDIAGLDGAPLPKEPYKVEITAVPDLNGDGATDLVDVEELLKSDANTISMLSGDGSFASAESVSLLEESDIVVTNPPFSLFGEFLDLLIRHEKQFLILGNMNAVTYKEVWPLVQDGRVWLGVTRTGSGQMWFRVPDDAPAKQGQRVDGGVRYQTVGNSAWFTNLDHSRRHEEIPLFRKHSDNPENYPAYENYDAVEVSRVVNLPVDYEGVMGVPITFLGRHNPDQFEIVGTTESNDPLNRFRTRVYSSEECRAAYGDRFGKPGVYDLNASAVVNGVKLYKRILIRRKK